MISIIDTVNKGVLVVPIKDRLGVYNFEGNNIDGYDEVVSELSFGLVPIHLHQWS